MSEKLLTSVSSKLNPKDLLEPEFAVSKPSAAPLPKPFSANNKRRNPQKNPKP